MLAHRISLTVFSVLFTSSLVFAGGMEGGGGKSVVCRDLQGKITSAEVLDLYEGRVEFGVSYKDDPSTYDNQVQSVFQNAGLMQKCVAPPGADCIISSTTPPSSITDFYFIARDHLHFLPLGTVLNPINDSYEVVAPKNCAIEQTVNYQNDNLILVNSEIWGALSETQRAALLVHESVYRYLRNYKEMNSRRARHFTSYLFGGGKVEDVYPGNDYGAVCWNVDITQPSTSFYLSKPFTDADGRKAVRMTFGSIAGRTLLTRSTVDLQDTPDAGSDIFDRLKHPESPNSTTFEALTTKSLFESGDLLNLRVGGGGISISGTSTVDESSIAETPLKCFFAEPL